MDNNNNNKDNTLRMPQCQEHFKLFSYLSMAIITIAILVGSFIILQHMEEEDASKRTLANQDTLIKAFGNITKNQELIQIVINETRRDNAAFFKILDGMAQAEIDDDQRESIISDKINKKLDKIMKALDIHHNKLMNSSAIMSSSR